MRPGAAAATAVFALVALAHLLRLSMGWPVTIGPWNAPMWASIVGVIVPVAIAVQLVREARA